MGLGHVMRCLTLADALKTQQRECLFLTRPHPGNLSDIIFARGHRVILLSKPEQFVQKNENDVDHAPWLGASQFQDAQETISGLKGIHPDWLIIDHYAIDLCWHKLLRPHAKKIFVIDDLADRAYDCDLLLDQTYGRKETDYRKLANKKTPLLLGSQYALLRPEFAKLRPKAIAKRKEYKGIQRILISMGGTDPHNITAKVLLGLMAVEWQNQPVVDVVLSSKAPYLNKIIEQAKQCSLDMVVSIDVNDMAKRMLQADLAIGAGGSTSWERCCLGLPTIMIGVAENQINIIQQLAQTGASLYIGTFKNNIANLISDALTKFNNNNTVLIDMAKKAAGIADGLGAHKVIFSMEKVLP
jgi:UDP-2,4-diacetamido-2,4,6-trideoxy-beta-L-altropyranose hydrolase